MNTLSKCAINAVLMLSATGYAQAETVRINQAFQSLLYLPLYVAESRGFFKEQGVDVKLMTAGGGAQSWAAVVGGSADFSIQDPVFVPKTIENGGDGVVVAAVQNAPSVFVLSKNDPTPLVNNLQHLSGKKVIVSPQPDTSWAYMSYMITEKKIKDVKMVSVSIGNELPALVAGAADYALTFEPSASQGMLVNHFPLVYGFPEEKIWYPFAFSSLTSTSKYVKENPETVQKVVNAFEKASRYIYQNFDDAVAVAVTAFPNLPPDVVKAAVKREVDAKGYPENVLVTQESWDNAMKIAAYTKNIKGYPTDATSYSKNVITTFADKAKAEADKP